MTGRVLYCGAVREPVDGAPDLGVLFVGEDNPRSDDPELALYPHDGNASGARLHRRVLRVTRETYLSMWRTNLCRPAWHEPSGRARAAALLADGEAPWSTVVMLGGKVARCFDYRGELFTRADRRWPNGRPFTLVYLPHPSGTVHTWNEPTAAELARLLLKRAAPQVPVGELALEAA